ncbi:hypothetical protein Pelo_11849 [Pelomyxa schiedti]|nr:hypothetical protein Pelo_11849 [Pelomyxa schiedti]
MCDETLRNVVTVSQIAWEYVVEATMVLPSHNRGVPLTASQCTWLMGVADALFPLVPRVCRVLMGGVKVTLWEVCPQDYGRIQTSRYFALKCAAEAGSKKCIDWILRNKETRNNRKECITVLRGLCAGGHIEIAKELVESGGAHWSGCSLLRWPVNDPDLIDDIREIRSSESVPYSLLYDACKGGHLEVVKWVMSKFGVGAEPWEFPLPFRAAVRCGHIDLVKWLASSTCAVTACNELLRHRSDIPYCHQFVSSSSLQLVRFCTELFYGQAQTYGNTILKDFIQSSPSTGFEFEEGCQWIKERFSLSSVNLECITNAKGLRWWINAFSIKPTQDTLRWVAQHIADEELVEWLILCFPDSVGTVEPSTFIWVCGNKRDSVAVLQCLLTKMTLRITEYDKRQCLSKALSHNNTSVAHWLNNKFHVMDLVNANSWETAGIFSDILCYSNGGGIGGIQWFLENCSVRNISEETVGQAVHCILRQGYMELALLLMKTFGSAYVPSSDREHAISQLLFRSDVSQARQISWHLNFSSFNVSLALSSSVRSGKVVKWLIQRFHLDEEQVTKNNNQLLGELITYNKKSCAEWLINKFHVTLHQIGIMTDPIYPQTIRSQVGTWKMLMRLFPEMTASFAKEHMMKFVVASDLHVKASKKMLGITDTDVEAEDVCTDAWMPCE